MTLATRTAWLPYGTGTGAPMRLFCLPHAGAGASVYRSWGAGLPPWLQVCPVQPPGREHRAAEPPYPDLRRLVTDLVDHLYPLLDGPYALLGHSVGAVVALELAHELRRRGAARPTHLFVTGAPAPHLPDPHRSLRELTVAQLRELLTTLGGTPAPILADPRYLELLLPLFRADLTMKETYTCGVEEPLTIPVTAVGASRDPRATPSQTEAWRAHTTGRFTHRLLDGGHFAVIEQAALVHSFILAELSPGR